MSVIESSSSGNLIDIECINEDVNEAIQKVILNENNMTIIHVKIDEIGIDACFGLDEELNPTIDIIYQTYTTLLKNINKQEINDFLTNSEDIIKSKLEFYYIVNITINYRVLTVRIDGLAKPTKEFISDALINLNYDFDENELLIITEKSFTMIFVQ